MDEQLSTACYSAPAQLSKVNFCQNEENFEERGKEMEKEEISYVEDRDECRGVE